MKPVKKIQNNSLLDNQNKQNIVDFQPIEIKTEVEPETITQEEQKQKKQKLTKERNKLRKKLKNKHGTYNVSTELLNVLMFD